MIDIKLIRENSDAVLQAMEKRGESPDAIDEVIELDNMHRQLLREAESLRAKRNDVSKQISKMKEKPAALIAEMRSVGDKIKEIETEVDQIAAKLEDKLLRLPNLPAPDVPEGKDSADNVEVRAWGKPREFAFTPLPHWDLGEKLGIIDFQRGVKLSGTRFYVLRGAGALLQRSLISLMLDVHVKEHGYTEVYPPFMVKRECLVGSSNLPKFADNLYHDAEEDYWFVPTAEVPLTNLHRDEIIAPGTLPINYVAHTACFRREKMAAGKDTRGIKRGHQFDKVELYKFVEPETSDNELGKLLKDAEDICRKLEIPYRVIQLCTGDMGFAATKSFDIEMWAPGCKEWLEVSSCSNCGDFQARRANIRYRPDVESKPLLVHTLNGSGLALPRVLIAIMENYQQQDGSIRVPAALLPYMNVEAIT
ncbi:MAG: serine--tRNA ligase [Dehalococcoidia bacterium]|nr:serine--tRNA ligase [Dehalococcoidia bacterium]MDD5493772.1 serine--tRNA ligase [Dehalococcoidia bacterium]